MSVTLKEGSSRRPARMSEWAPAALACMGVVFGDIGTSPLYALREGIKAASPHGAVSPEAVLGVVSLIFWSLILVISIKYALLIMRADNHGEGGILALLALVSPRRARASLWRAAMVVLGLIGATLLYGDGAITPAISVLSAIEGIEVYAPQLQKFVVPLTAAILLGLFAMQRKGTSFIGGIFGPIMLVWFLVIALLGLIGIARVPQILAALSPWPAISYLTHAGPLALAVIGGAFLAVTGGEAFYADMGHFGPMPIRAAWFFVALPALTLNYFGQGALLLGDGGAIENPFYQLAPEWSHYPLVLLSTVATVIASQSIISGAFSMTQQASLLGFLPRLNVVHTASDQIGQIYLPLVNWLLAGATLVATIGFGSSDALAGAFGIAVSLLMAITTVLATFVALHWKHNRLIVYAVNGSFLALDFLFFASTSTKLFDGGWFPLLISFAIAFLMLTWRKGQHVLDKVRMAVRHRPRQLFAEMRANPPFRLPGTAAVLGRKASGVPLALTQNLKHNHVLHTNIFFVTAMTTETPRVPEEERVEVNRVGEGVWRVILRYGFMEKPDVPQGIALAMSKGLVPKEELDKVTYYVGHETIIAKGLTGEMSSWREAIFTLMHRNAQRAGVSFNIPSAQIVEIGIEFEM